MFKVQSGRNEEEEEEEEEEAGLGERGGRSRDKDDHISSIFKY